MRAALFRQHGSLENLTIEEVPTPQPGPTDALLRVKAVSLNGFDPMVLRGIPGLRTPLPMILGADLSAEIAALGAAVDADLWRVGQRVAVQPNQTDGMMGETARGGLCEYITVDQRWLIPIPDPVSDEHAACLPTAYATAYRMIHSRGQLQPGERVLILGASGGVGTSCVLLAKAIGLSGTTDMAAVRDAVGTLTFAAPQGEIRVDPDSRHCYLRPRIGRSRKDGGFDIIADAGVATRPDPYLIWREPREAARPAERPGLRIVS